MNRRSFAKGIAALGGVGLSASLYAWQVEPFWLEFVKKEIKVKNLPKELEGKTLMQISDMHVGNRFDRSFISRSFKKARKLKPDFVVYTGDFVNWESKEQLDQLDEVFQNAVTRQIGTVGILGNHDYGKNWAEGQVANSVVEIVTSKGISILRNQQKDLDGLNFVGLDDYWAINFDPSKVMNKFNPKKSQYYPLP